MNKKRLIISLLAIITVVGATVGSYVYRDAIYSRIARTAAVVSGQEIKPLLDSESRYIRQIVAQDNSTSRTIMWQSDNSEADAVIEYRLEGAEKTQTIGATDKAFTDDGSTTYIHEATLTGLTPNTKYEYRVGYGTDRRSDWYRLETAGASVYDVLIYPDSQSGDYSQWEEIVKNSALRTPRTALYISMGDLVDNGEHAYQWRTWLNSIRPLSANVPLATTLGNHEMYTLDWKMREPYAYLNYFAVPPNGNEIFNRRYYSYDFGDVHYVVLDTMLYESNHEDNHDTHHPDLYDVQVQWLRQDLMANTKKWIVVLMHRDPFQYAFDRSDANRAVGFDDEGVLFMPIFDEFNVDLVLSAHLHSYRNRGHVRNFERDASGPLYILTGIAGDARRPKWKQHPLDVYVAPDRDKNNYMTMTVTPNKLIVKAFLTDGTQLDESVIEK
ncbi:metallophosphoesterase family protein [Veillonella sp.]|uniref:purple acid phosphatase family protein n=1 Tax=Veillonella sp. TaxID=1926307 RepID=UPI0029156CEA|nr:metallophosphoesterase family protein [Veillonella sp.]MDU3564363.1 metallophosphoesterase family protein [Veillonella sp.]MDU3630715.1 metallophosphoesterase family protein [Veillonella sp.]